MSDNFSKKCLCEFEELYKEQNNKLFVLNETDGGKLFRIIKPNYCPICGMELPEEME